MFLINFYFRIYNFIKSQKKTKNEQNKLILPKKSSNEFFPHFQAF